MRTDVPTSGSARVAVPGFAGMPETPAESKSAGIVPDLKRPVVAEQQHALRGCEGRTVPERQSQRRQSPAGDDLAIFCDHQRLVGTPGHKMILGRCQRKDWSESLSDCPLAAHYHGLALRRHHELTCKIHYVG